jgi:NAD(P)-dependent dehydrogenase (short-subunit alcohol dehydrogenase family)
MCRVGIHARMPHRRYLEPRQGKREFEAPETRGGGVIPHHAVAETRARHEYDQIRLAGDPHRICEPDQVASLRDRLSGRVFDMLFVRVMVTNSLSPMRVLESLEQYVPVTGLIGVMSSGQGSIANNEAGLREVYRGSKAALNMFMRSFAARHAGTSAGTSRAMVVMAPGWVRTERGGPDACLSIEESVPNLVNVLLSKQGKPGLEYLDYLGRTVPW